MDPNATWHELTLAVRRDDRRDAEHYANAMVAWLDRGGFLPSGVTRQEVDARLAQVLDPYGDKRDGVR